MATFRDDLIYLARPSGRLYHCDYEPTEGPCAYEVALPIQINPWEAAVNGCGKHPWFVWRPRNPANRAGPGYIASDSRGYYRRFGSREAAQKVADELNAIEEEQAEPILCGEVGYIWINYKGWLCAFHGPVVKGSS